MKMSNVIDLKGNFIYAMHGGGAIYGKRQTNSLDAIDYWYNRGKRVFEFDLAVTYDGQYVAVAHYLNQADLGKLEINEIPPECTEAWFMNQKLYSKTTAGLSPLSLKLIIDKLISKPDILVMLDLYGMFTIEESQKLSNRLKMLISDHVELYDRLLVEVYCDDMVKGIKSQGNGFNLIYGIDYGTIEYYGIDNKVTPEYLKKESIDFVSYPFLYTKGHQGELETFAENGFCIFCRTKSNVRFKQLKELGVNVNLIDYYYEGNSFIIHKITEYTGIDTLIYFLFRVVRKIKRELNI